MTKISAAIVGPGNIGTDLLMKLQRSQHVDVRYTVSVATHCTEADVSIQHFAAARDLGMETVGFLMLSHSVTPERLAGQARIMADAGCQCVYVVDSAGAMLPDDVTARVRALVAELGDDAQVGIHAHQNLTLGVANSIAAVQAGARQVDGTMCALGAGAGNSPTEVLAAVFAKLGVETGLDLSILLDTAAERVRPFITRMPWADRSSIVQGHLGVYSSFLLHAEQAERRYGVPVGRSRLRRRPGGHDHRHRGPDGREPGCLSSHGGRLTSLPIAGR